MLKKEIVIRFSPILKSENEILDEVVIKNEIKGAQGITTIKAEKIKRNTWCKFRYRNASNDLTWR